MKRLRCVIFLKIEFIIQTTNLAKVESGLFLLAWIGGLSETTKIILKSSTYPYSFSSVLAGYKELVILRASFFKKSLFVAAIY